MIAISKIPGESFASTPLARVDASGGRWSLALALIAFELARWQVLLVVQPIDSPLKKQFFETAHRVVDFGHRAYRDVAWDGPPLCLWLVAAPRVVDYRTQQTSPPRRILWRYAAIFRRLMFLIDAAAFGLLLAGAVELKRLPAAWAAWGYVAVTTPLAHVLYDRTELLVLLLLFASAWCWTRASRSGRTGLWRGLSAAGIGLAGATTSAALVMLPVLWAAQPRRSAQRAGPRWAIWPIVVGGFAGLALPYVIQFRLSGTAALSAIQLGSSRGVEVQSSYAVIAGLIKNLGGEVLVYRAAGLHYVRHAGDALLVVAATAAQASLCLGVTWAAARWRRRCDAHGTADFHGSADFQRALDPLGPWCWAALSALGMAWLSPELPAERFVWTLPLALWLALARCEPRSFVSVLTMLGAIVALTTLVFPASYYAQAKAATLFPGHGLVPDLDVLPVSILATRSLALGGLWWWLYRRVA